MTSIVHTSETTDSEIRNDETHDETHDGLSDKLSVDSQYVGIDDHAVAQMMEELYQMKLERSDKLKLKLVRNDIRVRRAKLEDSGHLASQVRYATYKTLFKVD
jgi:hypothetical protein